MYCAHFGLHRPPFNNTPDPAFYYGTPEHEEALATLEYATTQRKGFVLITGEIGAGKTLIGRMFLRRIEPRARTAIITHTHLNGRQLLTAICNEFELVVPPEASSLQLTECLQAFLLEQYARDVFVVIMLDEAQNLPDESFEAVRMLGNLEADDAKLIQICILGQPELRERFGQAGMRQLDQRLFRRFHLSTLTRDHTAAYIAHRLKVAGYKGKELFSPAAIDRIHELSAGTPRVVNRICDNALLTVYGRHGAIVDTAVIEEVAGAPAPVLAPTVPGEATLHTVARTESRPAAMRKDIAAVDAQVTLHAQAIAQISTRLDQNEEELRALGREAARQFEDLAAGIKELEQRSASAEQVERVRNECQASVREVLLGLESQSAALNQLRSEIDGTLTAAAGGQQASLDSLKQRFEAQVHELHQLYRDVTLSRSGIEDRVEALTGRVARNDEQIQGLDTKLAEQEQNVAALGQRFAGGLDAVERGLTSLRANAATRQELESKLVEQQRRVEALGARVAAELQSVQQGLTTLRENAPSRTDLEAGLSVRQGQVEALSAKVAADLGAIEQNLASLRENAATRSELDARLSGQQRQVEDLGAKVADELRRVQAGLSSLHDGSATRAELNSMLSERQRQVEALGEKVTAELEAVERGLTSLRESTATRSELDTKLIEQQHQVEALGARMTSELRAVERDLSVLRASATTPAELDAKLGEQERRIEALGARFAAGIESVENGLARLGSSAITRDELDRLQAEQQVAMAALRQQQEAVDASFKQWRNSTVEALRAWQDTAVTSLARRQDEAIESLESRQASVAASLRREQADAMSALRGEQGAELDALKRDHAASTELIRLQAGTIDHIQAGLAHHGSKVNELGERVVAQFNELEQGLARLRAESISAQEVEQWRNQHAAAVADLGRRINDEAESLDRFRRAVESQSASLSREQRAAAAELREHVLEQARRLRDLRHKYVNGHDAMRGQLAGLLEKLRGQDAAIDGLSARLAERERELGALDQRLAAQLEEMDQAMRADRERAASRQDVERMRREHTAALADVVGRITSESDALRQLEERVTAEATAASREHREKFEVLSNRINQQIARVRGLHRRMLKWQGALELQLKAMDERFAGRGAFEEFRAAAGAEAGEMRARIERQREAMESLIAGVVDRCHQIQDQLDAVDRSKAEAGDVERLSQRQSQDTAELLARLDRHKHTVREQMDQACAQWERTQSELSRLAATAAPVQELASLRERQVRDTGQLLDALAGQRTELEALLTGVSRRCDDIGDRLRALPANPVDAGELDALRVEYTEQLRLVCARIESGRSEFEGALRELTDRCRQVEMGIEDLVASTASAEDVERLREAHVKAVDEIVDRMERDQNAHQRDVLELNRRWEDLAVNLRSLAATVTPPATIMEIEQNVTANLSEMRARVDAAQRREREQMRSLAAALQQLTGRLTSVEQMDRPKPVKLELNMQAGRELGELIERSQSERDALEGATKRLEIAQATMDETMQRLEASLTRWQAGASDVERRSNELQASTGSSAELLKAIQRAQKVLDGKINSQRWQEELTRGEALAGRLETVIREGAAVCVRLHAAMRDFERCREEADMWSARRDEARQLTHNLVAILTKGQKAGERFEAELDSRRRVLSALAKNTAGLVNVIEEARQTDVQAAARRRPRTEPDTDRIAEIDWPRLHQNGGRTAAHGPATTAAPV